MHVVSHEVKSVVIDEIRISASEWDPRREGRVVWKEHMAVLLNKHAQKVAPKCNPSEFYHNMLTFSKNIGFGSIDTIIELTERVYDVELIFNATELNEIKLAQEAA
jgi:hypothetical protein